MTHAQISLPIDDPVRLIKVCAWTHTQHYPPNSRILKKPQIEQEFCSQLSGQLTQKTRIKI